MSGGTKVKRRTAKRSPVKTQNREMLAQVAQSLSRQMAITQALAQRLAVLERWAEALEEAVARIAPERFAELLDAELKLRGLERAARRAPLDPTGETPEAIEQAPDESALDEDGSN